MQSELCASVAVGLQTQQVKVHGNGAGEGKLSGLLSGLSRGGGLDLQEAASQLWGPPAAGDAQEPSPCVSSIQWESWNHRMGSLRLEKTSKMKFNL